MRQHASGLNRAWLSVIGILLVLAGAAGFVIGLGQLAPLGGAAGLDLSRPTPDSRVAGSAAASAFGLTWVVLVVAVVGAVLALLGLAWLAAQVPRTNAARPLRLEDNAEHGLTRCAPDVVTDAVEAQIADLPGVESVSAVLRGDAARPDLTVKVTAGDRSDIGRLLHDIEAGPVRDLGDALDTQVRRLGVQVEVEASRKRRDRITL